MTPSMTTVHKLLSDARRAATSSADMSHTEAMDILGDAVDNAIAAIVEDDGGEAGKPVVRYRAMSWQPVRHQMSYPPEETLIKLQRVVETPDKYPNFPMFIEGRWRGAVFQDIDTRNEFAVTFEQLPSGNAVQEPRESQPDAETKGAALAPLFKMVRGFGCYPVTPEKAAAVIANEMLSDLPAERRAVLRSVIEEWSRAWGDLTADAATGR